MRTFILLLLACLFLATDAWTQSARVQIIHNSPDPSVDIYVNGVQVLDNFAFRTATSFLDLPAGINLTVAVAPASSTSVAEAIATFPVNFEAGRTYAITASGVVGDMDTPFTLLTDDNARETAGNPAKVDLSVTHGSPDAPAVDVAVRTGGKLVSNLAYGSFTPYLTVDPGVYYLDVKPAGSNAIVQTFKADLSGLAGQAVRVLASGLLGGSPGFGLYAALANGAVVELPATPVARVQVIHNSPSPTVDVWANTGLLIDNFEYRTATPFIFVPAGVDIDLGIAADTSTSAASSLAVFPVNLENGRTYVVTASGIIGDANTPFTLIVNDNGREAAADPNQVDIAVLHGATNAPAVDVDAVFVADNVVSNLAYGAFTPYLGLAPGKYDFAVRAAGAPGVVASFRADLGGLGGGAATVFASGLLGGNPAFGLFAALPNGAVVELPLTPTARVQVIHNSPDPTVDVYAGNTRLLDNFAFRTATPFVTLPADRDIALGIAPANSASANDAIATFNAAFITGRTYMVAASGLVGSTATPFTLLVDDQAVETGAAGSVRLSVLHGAPDAPAVDVAVRTGGLLVSNLAYGAFTPYTDVPPGVYYLDVKPAGNSAIVQTFKADLTGLGGQVVRVFASGLLNGAPGFGLFAALTNGTVVELPASPVARVQVIHNSPAPTVDVWANTGLLIDNFAFREATPFIFVPAGVNIDLAVAPDTSTSAASAIGVFPVNLENGKTYVVIAAGVVADPNTPFQLYVNADARERAADAGQVDLAVFHGAPDAPEVDVKAQGGPVLFDNIAFGEFSNYLSLAPSEYVVEITPANDNNTVVQRYLADISALGGQSATLFASGFLGGGQPGFGVWAALADGATFALPVFVSTNDLAGNLEALQLAPNPAIDQVQVRFHLNEAAALRFNIRDVSGRLVTEGDWGLVPAGSVVRDLRLDGVTPGMYQLEIVSGKGFQTQKFVVARR